MYIKNIFQTLNNLYSASDNVKYKIHLILKSIQP